MSLKSFFKSDEVEFLCDEKDWGVIPPPYPARKLIPEWYKKLPMKLNPGLSSSTVKRCPPFLDAMQLGWIIPLAADVEFKTTDNAGGVNYKSSFYKPMVENHSYDQITTEESPHPLLPKPPMKFMNHWLIRLPKGCSMLFVPPLNRPDQRFECMAGLVDCDGYFEYINFPFTFNQPNFHGILQAGTPLVQAIPIKRSELTDLPVSVHKMTATDAEKLELTRRKRASRESYYRDEVWERK